MLYNVKAYMFYWGWGATRKFQKTNCVMGQLKCPIFNQNFKNLWIVPQLTKLLNMNHNRLPNSSKSIRQQRWGTKLEIKILLNRWGWTTCTQYAFKNVYQKYSLIASQFVPYSLPKSCWVVLYTTTLKRSMSTLFYWL